MEESEVDEGDEAEDVRERRKNSGYIYIHPWIGFPG